MDSYNIVLHNENIFLIICCVLFSFESFLGVKPFTVSLEMSQSAVTRQKAIASCTYKPKQFIIPVKIKDPKQQIHVHKNMPH